MEAMEAILNGRIGEEQSTPEAGETPREEEEQHYYQREADDVDVVDKSIAQEWQVFNRYSELCTHSSL